MRDLRIWFQRGCSFPRSWRRSFVRPRLDLEQLHDRISPAAALGANPVADTSLAAGKATIATIEWDGRPTRVYANEWLVQFEGVHGPGDTQIGQIEASLSALALPIQASQYLGSDGLVLVRTPNGMPFESVCDTLQPLGNVAKIEPNLVLSATLIPNDPLFGQQYGLNNTGQYVFGQYGIPDADIDAPEAWDTTLGSASVVAAVIDSGVDLTHPDLATNLYVNTREIPGNGIDDDQNGYVDDVNGWNFVSGNNSPQDDFGHGTAVAGTIAAVANNNVGVVGVAPGVKILPLKFLDASGNGSYANAIAALNYVAALHDSGVNIVATNDSWGSTGTPIPMLETAIQQQRSRSILFVAGAGNDGTSNDTTPFYPASYTEDNIISVTATDSRDVKPGFSNWGLTSVDIAAPGVAVFTTIPVSQGTDTFETGTSIATPFVTGAAALLASIKTGASYTEIRNAIFNGGDPNADFATNGPTPISTGKRLNLEGAIQQICSLNISVVGNDLVIADTSATGKNNNLTLSVSGSNLVIMDTAERFYSGGGLTGAIFSNGFKTVSVPLASFSGQVIFNTAAGNDTLTVNYPGSTFNRTITDNGGAGVNALAIQGASQGTATSNSTNATDGSIILSNLGTINYTGLASIANTGSASDRIFNLPDSGTTATLGDDGTIGNTFSRLSGSLLPTMTFANPTSSLSIFRGNSGQSLTVNSLPDITASLNVGTAAQPFASISITNTSGTGVSLSATHTLSFAAQSIAINAPITTAGGIVTFSATNAITLTAAVSTGGGNLSLTADADADGTGALTLSAAATIATLAGTVNISAADVDLQGTITSNTAVSIAPAQATRPLDLGTNTAGSLGLTDVELVRISTPTLYLGNSTSGTVTISAAISRPASTNVTIASGADILVSGGTFDTDGGNLSMSPGTVSASVKPTKSGTDIAAAAASFSGGNDLTINIAGTTVDAQYTQLNVAGMVNLANVNLILAGTYVPVPGDSFTIVSASSVTGTFSGLPNQSIFLINGVPVQITYTATAVTLVAQSSLATSTALVGENLPTTGGVLVTFRATVSLASPNSGPANAGNVTFFVDGTNTFTAAVDTSGMAVFTTSTLSYPATHTVYATYLGATYFQTSTSNTVSAVINDVVSLAPGAGPLPAATVGTVYSQTIAASGGTGTKTYSVSSGSLPAGLALGPTTGVISGNPTAAGTSSFAITATDSVGASATAAYSIVVSAAVSPPVVVSVVLNGNIPSLLTLPAEQHSRIVSLVVTFDQPVALDPAAFTLALHTNGVIYSGQTQPNGYGTLPTVLNWSSTDNKTWIITFSGNTDPSPPLYSAPADGLDSLQDGVYDLNVIATRVHPYGDPTMNAAADATTVFYRLYGDTDAPTSVNNGTSVDFTATINTTDNLAFRAAFNSPANYQAAFDFEGNSQINTADNLEFRNRFNRPLTWRV